MKNFKIPKTHFRPLHCSIYLDRIVYWTQKGVHNKSDGSFRDNHVIYPDYYLSSG